MTSFSEDKLFKNINNQDARILLDIINIDTVKVKIWTKELRLLNPKDYVPDIILELDFENLIIELQSTRIDDEFSKRALTYVAIANKDKENDKYVNLMVLSTVEESKIVYYQFNEESVFSYRVVSLKDLDADEIIKTVEPKISNANDISGKELVLYALVPMIVGEDMEKYIKRAVQNLIQLKDSSDSIINLVFGVEWLIVDKFVENQEDRNILCDLLGDRMSLIYEYGERKEAKGKLEGIREGIREGKLEGIREILLSLINSGDSLSEISRKTGKSIEELEGILADN